MLFCFRGGQRYNNRDKVGIENCFATPWGIECTVFVTSYSDAYVAITMNMGRNKQ